MACCMQRERELGGGVNERERNGQRERSNRSFVHTYSYVFPQTPNTPIGDLFEVLLIIIIQHNASIVVYAIIRLDRTGLSIQTYRRVY